MDEPLVTPHVDEDLPPTPPQKAIFLQPGQVVVSDGPSTITTILGSCVSVCLWDARRGRGGMNHFLLPDWGGRVDSSPRYGDVALDRLLEQLAALGSRAGDLRAKIFGGACVLHPFHERQRHLGTQNADAARRLLAAERIAIIAEDTGGDRGRKLLFNTGDGNAYVRWI